MEAGGSFRDAVPVGAGSAVDAPAPRASVAIGFGSPSNDSGVTRLDLNDILIRNPQASFVMRVAGDSMHDAGIDDADLLLIDRAVTPAHGHVVVAVVEQEFVCRRLVMCPGELCLRAADAAVADIVPTEGDGFEIWGVVTTVLKSLPA